MDWKCRKELPITLHFVVPLSRMTEKDYTKREVDQLIKTLDVKIDALRDDLREHRHELKNSMTSFEAETGASLMRIERQTTATNGRVNKLEKWRTFIAGGVAVLGFLFTALLAILGLLASTGHL